MEIRDLVSNRGLARHPARRFLHNQCYVLDNAPGFLLSREEFLGSNQLLDQFGARSAPVAEGC